ncbi:uncharacterized protein LOC135816235 [Sycon ciliatum]|uniref:uncharacterized protein LOC135816235 n=1 Tax=Sycon ciliatum TaxID=27933 RepID=UPI0031F68971
MLRGSAFVLLATLLAVTLNTALAALSNIDDSSRFFMCLMPREDGRCRAAMPRFYFDFRLRRCIPFVFSGCGANDNNFESEHDCLQTCSVVVQHMRSTRGPEHTAAPEPTTTPTTMPSPTTTPSRTTTPSPERVAPTLADIALGNASGWGLWNQWGRCYPSPVPIASCGALSGMQKRRRSCLVNGRCKGMRVETQPCTLRKCEPVYDFGKWSPCSASCGKGVQVRSRTCSSVQPSSVVCGGPAVESRHCKIASCLSATAGHICNREPCRNGATCVMVGQFFRCQCVLGTYGALCQFSHRMPVTRATRPTTEPATTTAEPTEMATEMETEMATEMETEMATEAATEMPTEVATEILSRAQEIKADPCPARKKPQELVDEFLVCLSTEVGTNRSNIIRHWPVFQLFSPHLNNTQCKKRALKKASSKWECLWFNATRRQVELLDIYLRGGECDEESEIKMAVMHNVPSRLPRACGGEFKTVKLSKTFMTESSLRRLRVKPTLPRLPSCMKNDATGVAVGTVAEAGKRLRMQAHAYIVGPTHMFSPAKLRCPSGSRTAPPQ